MKQKKRFKNFGNIGYRYWLSVLEWPIYGHRPQKSHIGRSLTITNHDKEGNPATTTAVHRTVM